MTIARFVNIQEEVKRKICGTLDKVKAKNPSEFVLLLARADYHEWLDRPDIDLSPYVVENEADLMVDITRQKFLVKYINVYIDRLMANRIESLDEREYEINIQLMMYSHIWESVLFLKQLERIACILAGKGYLWERRFDDRLKKGTYIKQNIINRLKKVDEDMFNLVQQAYSCNLRNDFAHSTYHINMEDGVIQSHHNGLFAGMAIKISDWEEIFLKSIMLSYHLNDILIKARDGFIEIFGDNSIPIRLPKKGSKGKFLNAFVFPEYDKGNSGRVRFSYLIKK